MPAWFNSVWPVATFVLGGASAYLRDFLTEKRQIVREANARQADRDKVISERRETFELSHLERLNDALQRLGRAAARAHTRDMTAARSTGYYGSEPLGDELAEALADANRDVYMLRHLALDDVLRTAVARAHVAINAPSGMHRGNPNEAEAAFGQGVIAMETAHSVIGERIREIYLSAPRVITRS